MTSAKGVHSLHSVLCCGSAELWVNKTLNAHFCVGFDEDDARSSKGKLQLSGWIKKTESWEGWILLAETLGNSRLCKSSQKDRKKRGIGNDSVCLLPWETGWEWTVPCFGPLLNKPFSWIFSCHFQEKFPHPTQEHQNPKGGWGRCCEFEILWNVESNLG